MIACTVLFGSFAATSPWTGPQEPGGVSTRTIVWFAAMTWDNDFRMLGRAFLDGRDKITTSYAIASSADEVEDRPEFDEEAE